MKESILEKFNREQLNPEVKLLNELLGLFCENRKDIMIALNKHFRYADVRHDGFKTFNLESWSSFGVGDSNPTLEIIKVDGKFLFGATAFGTLYPLNNETLNSKRRLKVLNVIMDFFSNPEKFFEK